MKRADSKDRMTPSQLITNQIRELADYWRGKMLARLRKLILESAPTSLRNGSGIPRYGLEMVSFAVPVLSKTT